MPLRAGETLSFYELLEPLGAGAMGEVWRARDTRLEREVAIKVLPEAFADDEERLRRFEREAKVLASLNHPNVAQIYGVDQVGDTCFLALELVEGEGLDERLRRGPLPVDEALDVCRQIAEGLEAAHEAGVIHRDLKPGNVRVAPDGRVKVLDFGLAKPVRPAGGSSLDSSLSTEAGRLLGTPTYMAPEQVRGRAIDRRVDVWAFGCVLRECLTGERTFAGETLSDVLGAVLHTEPDEAGLPAGVPPSVRALIARCLVKDPRRRLRDVGEARLVLEAPGRAGGAEAAGRPGPAFARAGILLLVGAALGALAMRGGLGGAGAEPAAPVTEPLCVSIHAPGLDGDVFPRIAPDGRSVVYLGREDGGATALYRRHLGELAARRLPGTEGCETFCFSPDGAHLAALVADPEDAGGYRLMKVDLHGAAPTLDLGSWPIRFNERSGIAWLPDGRLVSTALGDRLLFFPTGGDEAPSYRPILRAVPAAAMGVEVYRDLLDGRHVLGRTFVYEERGFVGLVVAVDVETGVETVLVRNASHGARVAAPDGSQRLLFARADTLFEAPFDPSSLAVGTARPLAAGLRMSSYWINAWFDVSRDGTLIWQSGGRAAGAHYVVAVEPDGAVTPVWGEKARHDGRIEATPDGSFFTSTLVAPNGLLEVWGSEVDAPLPRPLLAASGTDFMHAFAIPGTDDILVLRLGAEGEDGVYRLPRARPEDLELVVPVIDPARDREPVAVSPDGRWLMIRDVAEREDVFSLVELGAPAPRTPKRLLSTPRGDRWPTFSPDGRWIAQLSTAGSEGSVLLRRFHPEGRVGGEVLAPVPNDLRAQDLTWSTGADGAPELVLLAGDGSRIVAMPVLEGEPARFGELRDVARLDRLRVTDLAPLPGGRLLALVEDRADLFVDRIELSIGAFGGR